MSKFFLALVCAVMVFLGASVANSGGASDEWTCAGTVRIVHITRKGVSTSDWPFDVRFVMGRDSGIKGEKENSCITAAIAAANKRFGDKLDTEIRREDVTITRAPKRIPIEALAERAGVRAQAKGVDEYVCKVYTKWQARHLSGEAVREFPDTFSANSETQAWANALMRQEAQIKAESRFSGFSHKDFGFSAKNGGCWKSGTPKRAKPIGWPDKFVW